MEKKRNDMFFKLLLFIGVIMIGCTSDVNKKCFKVRIGILYCDAPNTVLVLFDKPNKFTTKQVNNIENTTEYIAAITDFPQGLIVKDSTIYVQFHYDEERENEFNKNPCPMLFGPAKILTFDGVSTESCNPLDYKY